jgi:RES domain
MPYIAHDPVAATTAIAAIRALDLQSATIEEILDLLTPIFRGYLVEAPRFQPGITLFRSRICDKPSHISALLAPPPQITKLGRVNREGKLVLYCCTSREVPFFESRPVEGQTVAIVRWITTAPLLVNHVGYTEAAFSTLLSNRKQASWGPRAITQLNEPVSAFLAEVFTQIVPRGSEYKYKLSVAIAEKLFLDDKFDGLLYPTVAMRANADNFALKLRYAREHLQFERAEYARIDGVRDFAFDITVLDTATELSADGSICWKGRLDQWVIREPFGQLNFTAEDGQWIARDKFGKIVEPE